MKICKKCKVLKNLGDFYKHDRMIDGHLNVCKNCTKKRISDYWYKNAKTLRIKAVSYTHLTLPTSDLV